jgi:hypothetical protein
MPATTPESPRSLSTRSSAAPRGTIPLGLTAASLLF